MTGVTKKIYCTVMLCNNLLMSTNILWNFDDSIKSDNNQINRDLSEQRIQCSVRSGDRRKGLLCCYNYLSISKKSLFKYFYKVDLRQ